ncbi:hypothetical protein [Kineobactrum salinum]|uniref:Uncharacterized protein n=1 Tax=Kineobactrum salinum TaxID=2708301 RepID=A0A6C0TZW5_9GAMM|nr:hypothetical protein [Kineobactrum salinum]QIB65380.1 hypothetical protein G3T16_08170 [Kineobactrum salinum]
MTAYLTILRQLWVLIAISGLLWGLHLFARLLATPVLLAIWLLLSLLIARGLFWHHRIRRRAWLRAYVRADSVWQRWLRGGALMAVVHASTGLALAAVLLVALTRLTDAAAWRVLLGSGLLVVALRLLFEALARDHVQPDYLVEFSWRLTLPIAAALLLAVLIWLAAGRPQPDFSAATLAQAVWHLADRETARSDLLRELLQLAAAGEGLQLWLAQQLVQLPVARGLAGVLVWLLVFAGQAVFVGAWLLVLNGALVGVASNADSVAEY